MVDMHCMAKAKKIRSAKAPPGVSSFCRPAGVLRSAHRLLCHKWSEGGHDGLARGDGTYQAMPIFQLKPRGLMTGSTAWPIMPA